MNEQDKLKQALQDVQKALTNRNLSFAQRIGLAQRVVENALIARSEVDDAMMADKKVHREPDGDILFA